MHDSSAVLVTDAELGDLLSRGIEVEASDLHLVVGYPPTYRIHGRLEDAGTERLTPDATKRMITDVLPEEMRELRPGDRVSLGYVDLTFLLPREFYYFVKQFLDISSITSV